MSHCKGLGGKRYKNSNKGLISFHQIDMKRWKPKNIKITSYRLVSKYNLADLRYENF